MFFCVRNRVGHSAPFFPLRCGKCRPGLNIRSAAQNRLPFGIHVNSARGNSMLLILINVLVIIVVGAILFYLIDRFVRDGRLANLLKILVVLICLAAILQRLLPVLGIGF